MAGDTRFATGKDGRLTALEVERLFSAMSSLATPQEARSFLLDVCSRREILDLAQRLEVATMLRDGASYLSVSRSTGASSTTVSRVSKCLNGPEGGYRLVLIGIGVSGMLSAMTTILLARSDLDLASQAQVWLAGSLAARTWEHAGIGAIGVVVLVPVLAVFARRLSVMEMGDDQAEGLGVATERTRLVVMLVGVVLAASAVAAAGPIAFVALAAPQITRRLTGVAGVQVLASALVGSLLLVVADLVSVNLPSRLAVPVGLVTGVIGGLYLLWVLSAKEDV